MRGKKPVLQENFVGKKNKNLEEVWEWCSCRKYGYILIIIIIIGIGGLVTQCRRRTHKNESAECYTSYVIRGYLTTPSRDIALLICSHWARRQLSPHILWLPALALGTNQDRLAHSSRCTHTLPENNQCSALLCNVSASRWWIQRLQTP